MAKLILEMQVSLDGFMAGPEGQTDWMVWNWGPAWTWDAELQGFHTGERCFFIAKFKNTALTY